MGIGEINMPENTRSALDIVLKATAFAAEKHRTQRRKDAAASPYINHPIALASVLCHEGKVDDPIAISAALLHDTVEDTETTAEELRLVFGDEITSVVLEMTDDMSLPKDEKKRLQVERAPHLSPRARQVKLADKICNLRDVLYAPPASWPLARKQEYFEWCKQVVDGLRGHNPVLEAVFDGVYEKKNLLV